MDDLIADAILGYMRERTREYTEIVSLNNLDHLSDRDIQLCKGLIEIAHRFVVDDDEAFDKYLEELPIQTVEVWNEIIDNLDT